MFHRPTDVGGLGVDLGGGGGGTGGLSLHQNENMVRLNNKSAKSIGAGTSNATAGGGNGKTIVFQTPSNSKKQFGGGGNAGGRRRVLGDISNHKSTNETTVKKALMGLQQNLGQSTVKPKSVSSKYGGSLIPKLSSSSLSSTTTKVGRGSSSVIPTTTRSAHRSKNHSTAGSKSVVKLQPQFQKLNIQHDNEQITSQIRPKTQIKSDNVFTSSSLSSNVLATKPRSTTKPSSIDMKSVVLSKTVELDEPYPEIEQPAGRTWKQQLEYDLKDEDDVASTSTLDYLLNDSYDLGDEDDEHKLSKRTMWDDWEESLWQRREKEQQDRDEQDEKEMQEQIQKMIEQDKAGLESLFDVPPSFHSAIALDDDDLSIGSANYGFKGDMDSNLLALDDDWSSPASSVCEPTNRSGDDSLLLDF